jgi:hypothetical protein
VDQDQERFRRRDLDEELRDRVEDSDLAGLVEVEAVLGDVFATPARLIVPGRRSRLVELRQQPLEAVAVFSCRAAPWS